MSSGALYWYGNQCEWVTDGWGDSRYTWSGSTQPESAYYETNCIHIANTFRMAMTKRSLNTSNYSTTHMIAQSLKYYTDSNPHASSVFMSTPKNNFDVDATYFVGDNTKHGFDKYLISNSNFVKANDMILYYQNNGAVAECKLYALWAE